MFEIQPEQRAIECVRLFEAFFCRFLHFFHSPFFLLFATNLISYSATSKIAAVVEEEFDGFPSSLHFNGTRARC